MTKNKVSVSKLARLAADAYSRPVELVSHLALEAIASYSSRGTIYIKHIEIIASAYLKIYPDSAEPINIFLKQIYKVVE